jgi:branched-subunit amino acid permease
MKNIFSSVQLKLFGISLLILIAGYFCLAQGPVDNPISKTLAPLLIVGVYCVLVPAVFFVKGKKPESTDKKTGV